MGVARNVLKDARLVPGGGASEMAVAATLKKMSMSIDGVEQVRKFSSGCTLDHLRKSSISLRTLQEFVSERLQQLCSAAHDGLVYLGCKVVLVLNISVVDCSGRTEQLYKLLKLFLELWLRIVVLT